MKHPLLPTNIRVMSILHTKEFRHMSHLAANLDICPARCLIALRTLSELKLIETHLEPPKPHDGDKSYRFTKIKLTRLGSEIARKCFELEELLKTG